MNVGDYVFDPALESYGMILEKVPQEKGEEFYADVLWDGGDRDYIMSFDLELVFSL